MITEDEAFWAGIAVAVMMLGGGFSMLFLHTFTGYGAVVLALGLMTMALTIQLRAKPSEIEAYTPVESSIWEPTPPVELPREVVETQPSNEPQQVEALTEHSPTEPQKEKGQEHAEEAKPAENATATEPPEPTTTEPNQPPPTPKPQAPTDEKVEPPKTEETPKENPPLVLVPD